MRNALDWLRDSLSGSFETQAGKFLKDPWAARNDYLDVTHDRSAPAIDRFLLRRLEAFGLLDQLFGRLRGARPPTPSPSAAPPPQDPAQHDQAKSERLNVPTMERTNDRFDWRRRPPSCQVAWATHDVAPEGVSRR